MSSRVVYDEELRKLHREIVQMGEMAQGMVEKGMRAFLDGDAALKDEVARMDREIYRHEQLVERHCIELIALHQPVASDLRTVSTCLKLITDLNRIGRYGRDIAELADRGEHGRDLQCPAAVPLMSRLAVSMVADAIAAFVARDEAAARALFERDDEVDSLWDSIFRGSLTYMLEEPRNIPRGTRLILVSRYLERIADHACNIGERVVFMVSGVRIDPFERKRPPRLPGPEPPAKATSSDGFYSARLDEK